jgi:hypothetical protein
VLLRVRQGQKRTPRASHRLRVNHLAPGAEKIIIIIIIMIRRRFDRVEVAAACHCRRIPSHPLISDTSSTGASVAFGSESLTVSVAANRAQLGKRTVEPSASCASARRVTSIVDRRSSIVAGWGGGGYGGRRGGDRPRKHREFADT